MDMILSMSESFAGATVNAMVLDKNVSMIELGTSGYL